MSAVDLHAGEDASLKNESLEHFNKNPLPTSTPCCISPGVAANEKMNLTNLIDPPHLVAIIPERPEVLLHRHVDRLVDLPAHFLDRIGYASDTAILP